jgi:Domain of unknown function (DUF5011)
MGTDVAFRNRPRGPESAGKAWSQVSGWVNFSATDDVALIGDVLAAVNDTAAVVAGTAHIDTTVPGLYVIVYSARDAAGNFGAVRRTVRVGTDAVAGSNL